jgi:hypothetical protein
MDVIDILLVHETRNRLRYFFGDSPTANRKEGYEKKALELSFLDSTRGKGKGCRWRG